MTMRYLYTLKNIIFLIFYLVEDNISLKEREGKIWALIGRAVYKKHAYIPPFYLTKSGPFWVSIIRIPYTYKVVNHVRSQT